MCTGCDLQIACLRKHEQVKVHATEQGSDKHGFHSIHCFKFFVSDPGAQNDAETLCRLHADNQLPVHVMYIMYMMIMYRNLYYLYKGPETPSNKIIGAAAAV